MSTTAPRASSWYTVRTPASSSSPRAGEIGNTPTSGKSARFHARLNTVSRFAIV
jgi:hypothetical protein